jgi:NADH-quinone oxidoreductase subunit D
MQQFNPYVDRMDYVAAVSNGLGYCLAVEKLLNVEAPPRAQAVRVILTELNRIASHLLWLGTHALDIGAITPVFYCLREREEVLKIFEKYCGARLTTHAFRIGGLQYETYDGFEEDVKNSATVHPQGGRVRRTAHQQPHLGGAAEGRGHPLGRRVQGIRRHRAGAARGRRESGTCARRSRIPATSSTISKSPPRENGDTYDRYIVRMQEMRQSTRIIRAGGGAHSEGPIMGKVPKVIKPPVGEAYVSIEAPKGELGYFIVSDNSTQPYRVRVRPPSFVNLQALDRMVRGGAGGRRGGVIGTLDIVLGEVDR